jgi:hypothetical protein
MIDRLVVVPFICGLIAHACLPFAPLTPSPRPFLLTSRSVAFQVIAPSVQYSCLVGRNRISLTSTSSGWLMANMTMLAKESAGMAFS